MELCMTFLGDLCVLMSTHELKLLSVTDITKMVMLSEQKNENNTNTNNVQYRIYSTCYASLMAGIAASIFPKFVGQLLKVNGHFQHSHSVNPSTFHKVPSCC